MPHLSSISNIYNFTVLTAALSCFMGWRLELMSISCANVRVMPGTNQYSCSNTKWSSPQHHNKLTWWLGKIRVSAITTFSRRPAANTITSAISSGVSGSQFLHNNPSALPLQQSFQESLTHIRHQPSPYLRRIAQRRIPNSRRISLNSRAGIIKRNPSQSQPDQDQSR